MKRSEDGWHVTFRDAAKAFLTILAFVIAISILLWRAEVTWDREARKHRYVVEYCAPNGHEWYLSDDLVWTARNKTVFTNALNGRRITLVGQQKVIDQALNPQMQSQ